MGGLEAGIDAAEFMIPRLRKDTKELDAALGGLLADVEKVKKDRTDAKDAMAKAIALRAKKTRHAFYFVCKHPQLQPSKR